MSTAYLSTIIPRPARQFFAEKMAGPEISAAAATARMAEWKAEARRIGATEDHGNEVILSLFDDSGVWSQPYAEAGYQVCRYDIKRGRDLLRNFPYRELVQIREAGFRIKGVLSAPPCTSFAASGARWWKAQHDACGEDLVEDKYGRFAGRYFESPLEYAVFLVAVSELVVEVAEPEDFHVMENPIGRIQSARGLPKPLLTFDPFYYGDPYTKRTQLWGKFNPYLPTAHVAPTQAGLIHKASGWNKAKQKTERSKTPEGFAYAFFMANH